MTPAQWVILVRVRRAQQLLETTWHAVDRVASLVGFASAATLRVQFQRIVGTSPQAYRRSFRGVQG
jgi:transcriptional regulator GlxA family with amidase domain